MVVVLYSRTRTPLSVAIVIQTVCYI